MRNRKNNKYFFNMVEIILAIGVLAFGFSSILGIFPVAIKIVKNSRTESMISDAASNLQAYYYSMSHVPLIDRTSPSNDQLNNEFWYSIFFYEISEFDGSENTPTQYESLISTPATKYINFFEEGTSLNDLRDAIAATANPSDDWYVGPKFLEDLKIKAATIKDSGNNVKEKLASETGFNFRSGLDLFQPNTQKSYYYLVKGDEDFENIDLTAQIIIWKSKMQKVYTTSDSSTEAGLDYKYGVVLNMEISWPINVPYAEREKRYYQFTIANPRKR